MKATLVTCMVWPLVTPQESSLKRKTGGAEHWVEGVHTAKGHEGPAYPVHTQTLAGSCGQPSQRLGPRAHCLAVLLSSSLLKTAALIAVLSSSLRRGPENSSGVMQ